MYVSETLAISAALCIALSGMLISELKGRVDIVRLARWQMLAAFAMTGALSLILGGWRTVGLTQLGLLAASSLFGIILASTTYFAAIYKAGPRNTALLFSLTSPFALALGYAVLGETISRQQGMGIILVLAGIVLAIGLPGREARLSPSTSVPWAGIALGVVTALGQAMGSLLARPAMARRASNLSRRWPCGQVSPRRSSFASSPCRSRPSTALTVSPLAIWELGWRPPSSAPASACRC